MLVNDTEARTLGMILAAVGLGTVAASVARLVGVPADSAVYVFLGACGSPLVLGFAVVMYVWARGELSRARVAELEAKAKLQPAPQQSPTLPQQATREQMDASVQDHHWRQMTHRFVTAGDLYGFGIRVLAKDGKSTKVISWGGWGEMTKMLKDSGVLSGSGDGTRWASEWNYHRWLDEKDRIALLHPDKEPPDVTISVRNTTTQQANSAAD